MKKKLIFDIECGEKTCASEPGKFCQFLILGMGQRKEACVLFGPVDEKDGWIQRHKDCLLNERNNK
jgi:hypothetical protein